MSFTINIYYEGRNGLAKKFANEMISSGIVNEIRSKEGNLRYEYFEPFDDKETILLIDSWKDQESLDKHHKSETMNKIIKLRDKYDLHMKVEKYIPSDNNNQDEKYIRK
ncbi:MAG: antibiotic biosynthesis monooxygenase [Bacilli bacterium]|nr:antibiotic biosynthesis monooxygenase [Bacilli bacterium]